MKCIFLDIDGVLNCEATFRERKTSPYTVRVAYPESLYIIDARKLELLASLARSAVAVVVLSSSWRYSERALKGIVALLNERCVLYHGCTTQGRNLSREEEISEYLASHPEIQRFVILDDECIDGALAGNHVQTSFYEDGLEERHITQALKLLSKKEE